MINCKSGARAVYRAGLPGMPLQSARTWNIVRARFWLFNALRRHEGRRGSKARERKERMRKREREKGRPLLHLISLMHTLEQQPCLSLHNAWDTLRLASLLRLPHLSLSLPFSLFGSLDFKGRFSVCRRCRCRLMLLLFFLMGHYGVNIYANRVNVLCCGA